MSKVEQPKYNILIRNGNIEYRLYNKIVLAEVVINANRTTALKNGFRILANYIFVNNIEMTAPVLQTKVANGWKISFIIPQKYKLTDLPKDYKVQFRELEKIKLAAIIFSGFNSDYNIIKHETKLRQHLNINNTAIYAFYNPPWVIPILRRNEVLIKIN